MEEDRIHLQIVTAAGPVYDNHVRAVTLPLAGGSCGILADHAPLMGAVTDGVVRCTFGEAEHAHIAVGIGVANVAHNEVTLLVRTAEPAGSIDLSRAEASERRARERLAQKAAGLDAVRAEASLHRALARQKAVHMMSE